MSTALFSSLGILQARRETANLTTQSNHIGSVYPMQAFALLKRLCGHCLVLFQVSCEKSCNNELVCELERVYSIHNYCDLNGND